MFELLDVYSLIISLGPSIVIKSTVTEIESYPFAEGMQGYDERVKYDYMLILKSIFDYHCNNDNLNVNLGHESLDSC